MCVARLTRRDVARERDPRLGNRLSAIVATLVSAKVIREVISALRQSVGESGAWQNSLVPVVVLSISSNCSHELMWKVTV